MDAAGYWCRTKDGDPAGFALYRRHYSSRKNPTPKQRQFVGPGSPIVLLGKDERALFVWLKQTFRADGQRGVSCAVFRNEGPCRSSELIRAAMLWAWCRWPGERLFTMVDPKKVRSSNPGYCFIVAGWRKCGTSKAGQLIFEAYEQ